MRRKTFALAFGGALLVSGSALAEMAATATTELNIRSGPGPHHEVVGVIPADAEVTLLGCLDAANWCQIEHDGTEGWAYGVYLTAEEAAEEAEPERFTVIERRTEMEVPVVTYTEDHSGPSGALGMTAGAAAGALVAGPVGAAVGGAAAGLLGGLANVPEPVTSYVRTHRTETVILDGEVVVGAEVPETVELAEVPESEFRYVYINNVPAIIEPETRRIVHIIR
jgi:uncharacterized protein YraI